MTDIRCHQCHRFLGSTTTDTDMQLKCANCKSYETYRIRHLSTLFNRGSTLSRSNARKAQQGQATLEKETR